MPEGYKRIGSEILPNDWVRAKFSDIAKISSGLVNPKKEPYVHMQHIGPENIERDTGRILPTKSSQELNLISGKFVFDSNSIVYSKIRPNLNKVCIPNFSGICSADCYSIKPVQGTLKEYLFYNMLSYSFYKSAVACSMRTGMPKINQDDLNFIPIYLSTDLKEQAIIAEILTTQDRVIELKEKLIAEKQRQKKYLMQQLLTGKKRLPGFTKEWKTLTLSHCLESRDMREIPSKDAPLMAFVAGIGVTHKGERYDRSFLVKDDSKKYKRTELNDFIYSSNNLDVGSIGLNKYGTAVISDVYEIFKLKSEMVPEVLSEIIQIKRNLHNILRYRQGAFYGQYRIYAKDFLSVKVRIPSYEEQKAIVDILSTADREIELLQQELEQEKQKKKALMQLLLTGIVRVSQ